MAYITDMTKTPIQMLLGLINADNDFGLLPVEVNALAPVITVADVDGRNTKIDIDLLVIPSEVEGDFVEFKYERIDLGTLFSQAGASFREVDVPLNVNGVPADASVFYAEILRKFGVAMNTTDFAYSLKAAGVITITANVANVAYIGSFDITVGNSLQTRVATKVLDGFEIPA